jgi:hypothetical protein
MKRFAAFALALVLFTVPTVALAIDHPKLADIFNQYEKTIWRDDA